MAKLKALRGSIGDYGRVAANGIIDIDDEKAKKYLATKRFVPATAADIAAATKRQDTALKLQVVGATPGFSSVVEAAAVDDSLTKAVEDGRLSPESAVEIASLKLEISSQEAQAYIEQASNDLVKQIEEKFTELDQRETELTDLIGKLDEREAEMVNRIEELDQREAELNQRQADMDAAAKAAPKSEAKGDKK